MSTEKNRTQNQKYNDNYPTNHYPADNYPTDCHSPKDSSRYSHSDTRPQRPGPGGEAEE